MKVSQYVPIGFFSYFSLLKGTLSPEDVCRLAAGQGFRAAGLADINNFYGLIRFLNACREAGIRPVVGARIKTGGEVLFTAYVTGAEGYARLNRMITAILTEREKGGYQPLEELEKEGWKGLTIVTERQDVAERLIPAALKRGSLAEKPEKAGLFLSVTYGRSFAGNVRFARSRRLPLVAVNNARYAEATDRKICNLLRAVELNCKIEELPPSEFAIKSDRFVSSGEMEGFFSAIPEAIANTTVIAERAWAERIIHKDYQFPCYKGMSEGEAFRQLKRLCLRGIQRRYRGRGGREVFRRLDHELSIIREKGFANYFLVVHDIVSRYPRTCGRGSSASSIVSYLLGITHVDPIKYNLFFERFLNRGRKDPPDIDVDFPWDERAKTLGYVFESYRGRAGMVADHVTFGPRSSLREPAKTLGFPEEETKKFLKYLRKGEKEKIPSSLLEIARRIKGFPRYIGTHPGGVVITPTAITNYTHLQLSPLGYPVIAWEKNATEDAGLVKIDLLGNRSLGVLRDAIELVNTRPDERRAEKGPGDTKGRKASCIEWDTFDPLGNRETAELIASGNTIGIFYVESPATRQLLKKMKRGNFENLIIASSIIRPAANRYVRAFVERLHGKPYRPLHPLVEETLRETYGIMVYQEDVSRIAIDLAGFSPEEADMLRKVISKKDRITKLNSYRKLFFERGLSRGVAAKVLEEVWAMILSFDGYSFCKAHSASYAMVSYKLAYLKRFYPLEFIVSVINNGGGFYTRQTYIDECRRMGFEILPPDVNGSEALYSIEELPVIHRGKSMAPGTGKRGRAMRIGLFQLKNLRYEFVVKLLEERKRGGLFRNLEDFILRMEPGIPEMRVLIKSGALDLLAAGYTRPEIFWKYYHTLHFRGCFVEPEIPHSVGDYTELSRLLHQYESLGVIIDRYPIEIFYEKIRKMAERQTSGPLISSREIPRFIGKRITLAGMLVTGKEVLTKNRERMLFLSFEDTSSVYETVLFPSAFRRFYRLLEPDGIYLVTGKVEWDMGAVSINIENLELVGTLSSLSEDKGHMIEQPAYAVV